MIGGTRHGEHCRMPAMRFLSSGVSCLLTAFVMASAAAQTSPAPPAAEAKAAPTGPLASLAWLEGCWRGTAGAREFREQWMPLRGAMMLGVSQTVDEKGATQGYEFLRLEPRAGGVFYVAAPSGKPEAAFRFDGETTDKVDGRSDTIFTFVNPADEFPKLISYRRSKEGWLYATVEGKVGDKERKAVYPMRRIDCATGELILR